MLRLARGLEGVDNVARRCLRLGVVRKRSDVGVEKHRPVAGCLADVCAPTIFPWLVWTRAVWGMYVAAGPAMVNTCRKRSSGWAVGGVSTHFSTCSDRCEGPNAEFFEEPGSPHSGGALFGMVDASVHFISETIDTDVFKALGSMGEGDGPPSF